MWSIDHPLTNTIEILDAMWETYIHNLSVSQMWVTWSVDGGSTKYWLVEGCIEYASEKKTRDGGGGNPRKKAGKGVMEEEEGVYIEHRKAIKDGSVTRYRQQPRVQKKEVQRLKKRSSKAENVKKRSTHIPRHQNTPFTPHSTHLPNQYDHVKT